ncbi:hypothetical protein FP744_10006654 [Trichoderma asperellum]|nr:hypothetical protein LI328DRAFT_125965 [Trichoderma asperelloides]
MKINPSSLFSTVAALTGLAKPAAAILGNPCPDGFDAVGLGRLEGSDVTCVGWRDDRTYLPAARLDCHREKLARIQDLPIGAYGICDNYEFKGVKPEPSDKCPGGQRQYRNSWVADIWACMPQKPKPCPPGMMLQNSVHRQPHTMFITSFKRGTLAVVLEEKMLQDCRKKATNTAHYNLGPNSWAQCDRVRLIQERQCDEDFFHRHRCGDYEALVWYCIPELHKQEL